MTEYETQTGFYVLVDADGRIGARANVTVGTHPVPDWVDPQQSFDVDTLDDLRQHDVDPHYRGQS